MIDTLIKGVTLFDTHAPDHNKPCMEAIAEFLPVFKPNYLIYGGDLGNWGSFSKWEEERVLTYQTTDEFEAVDSLITEHKKLCGDSCKFIWLLGNHDEWVIKYCQLADNIKHAREYDFNKRLRLKERNITLVPINKPFKVGKLAFVHGLYLNEFHAKKTLLAYNANIVYGHAHTNQSFTYVSPIDESQVRIGRARPCLCDLNPEYMKNRPHSWSHGFSVWYVRKDGTFNEYCVDITKGVFTWNDRTYGL